jgi:uncharacterized damage-inducible protein DinB
MALARLAGHVAEIPGWVVQTLEHDSLDIHPAGGSVGQVGVMTSRKQLLETFDENVAAARAALSKATDETLRKSWTLHSGGKAIFTLPRTAVLRSFVMNHLIHHRAQLGVYLRLNDLPVPALYGPSADEGGM